MKSSFACALTLVLVVPAFGQDSNIGRNLAAQCANCHGTDGRSQGVIPSLAGLDRAAFTGHMSAFKGGQRGGAAATIMHQIAKGYSEEQIALMAAYFAAQPARK